MVNLQALHPPELADSRLEGHDHTYKIYKRYIYFSHRADFTSAIPKVRSHHTQLLQDSNLRRASIRSVSTEYMTGNPRQVPRAQGNSRGRRHQRALPSRHRSWFAVLWHRNLAVFCSNFHSLHRRPIALLGTCKQSSSERSPSGRSCGVAGELSTFFRRVPSCYAQHITTESLHLGTS